MFCAVGNPESGHCHDSQAGRLEDVRVACGASAGRRRDNSHWDFWGRREAVPAGGQHESTDYRGRRGFTLPRPMGERGSRTNWCCYHGSPRSPAANKVMCCIRSRNRRSSFNKCLLYGCTTPASVLTDLSSANLPVVDPVAARSPYLRLRGVLTAARLVAGMWLGPSKRRNRVNIDSES